MFKNSLKLFIKRINILDVSPMIVNTDNIFRPKDNEFTPIKRTFGSNGKTTILYKKDGMRGIYIRPTEPINKYQFENLFGFGCGCLGYDKNRMVYYPAEPINYN